MSAPQKCSIPGCPGGPAYDVSGYCAYHAPTCSIDVVFAPVEGSPNLTFVEVEDGHGNSIAVGKWVQRDDGYTVLRLATEGGEG